ncbi:fumarylacetoacetate hydrolase domain-containing protein 2-like [Ostrea edulis]|uniref:fumarylacetoacetate hydrolase domain-containing protein 2-like n=1 Tax=Ostrea edulis TaxID=37623 RepID=UPI0024AF0704|nr:fumarylacetoacetate hydrolase domain-containing protein 2-like [Ostrea edulis]
MRFVQFLLHGERKLGLERGNDGDIVDLCAGDRRIPTDLRSFIEGGDKNLKFAENLVEERECVLRRDSVRVVAPILNPEKVLCVGMNYRDHCEEHNTPVPEEPVVFNKFPSCIIGPTDDLEYPTETEKLDWEVELAFVIGKEANRIKEDDALKHIFGFTVALDVNARDWLMGKNGGQVLLGTAMDGFCPLGPAIVTIDEVDDPHNLGIRCKVNDVVKQNSNTNQLIHKSAAIIAHISRFMTLKPGDVILTGSPPGVGFARNPPEFLKRGDVVQCEIDNIGKIINRVV